MPLAPSPSSRAMDINGTAEHWWLKELGASELSPIFHYCSIIIVLRFINEKNVRLFDEFFPKMQLKVLDTGHWGMFCNEHLRNFPVFLTILVQYTLRNQTNSRR